jgi:hypothetical protein
MLGFSLVAFFDPASGEVGAGRRALPSPPELGGGLKGSAQAPASVTNAMAATTGETRMTRMITSRVGLVP